LERRKKKQEEEGEGERCLEIAVHSTIYLVELHSLISGYSEEIEL